MDKFKEKIKKIILTSYKVNFNTDINDEKCEEIFKSICSFTETELRKLSDFSEQTLDIYMMGSSNDITFSPACVYNEIEEIIRDKGITKFATLEEYKRAREMETASRFCIANFKMTGKRLMMRPQDSPDIALLLPGEGTLKDKSLVGFQLEVMEIPQREKNTWTEDIVYSLVNFIKDKKFNMRYGGHCDLIVCIDFDQNNINFADITRLFNEIKNIPYRNIWITTSISADLTRVAVFQVYPKLIKAEFDFITERALY